MKYFEVVVRNRKVNELEEYIVNTLGAVKVSEESTFFRRKRRIVYAYDSVNDDLDYLLEAVGVKRKFRGIIKKEE